MRPRHDLGRTNAGVLIGLCLIALVFLLFAQRGCWLTGLHAHGGWPFGGWGGLFWLPDPLGLVGVWVLIQLALAVWVGADATRRGQSGLLWGLLVFFTSVVGLVVYLIAVPMLERGPAAAPWAEPTPAAAGRCASCGTALEADFTVCPNCGTAVPTRCECGRPLQPGWKICPYCGRPLGGGASPATSPESAQK